MEKKKNIIVIVLVTIIAILCGIIGFLLGSELYDENRESVGNTNTEENSKEENSDNQMIEENNEVNIKESFNNFVINKNLKTNTDIYDEVALNNMNCIEAISASGEEYSLEFYTFKDSDSAKKEYNKQNNYQLEVKNVKQVISSGNIDNYDYYEAILVPNLEKSPAATGNEQDYVYQLRIDNYYISLFETSTNSDKTSMINIANELKSTLGIK